MKQRLFVFLFAAAILSTGYRLTTSNPRTVSIEKLALLSESAVPASVVARLAAATGRGVMSGNFPNAVTSGNFPNAVTSGNFPNAVTSGNFPSSGMRQGITGDTAYALPSPQIDRAGSL